MNTSTKDINPLGRYVSVERISIDCNRLAKIGIQENHRDLIDLMALLSDLHLDAKSIVVVVRMENTNTRTIYEKHYAYGLAIPEINLVLKGENAEALCKIAMSDDSLKSYSIEVEKIINSRDYGV